jgi:hypothetical protein
MLLPEHVLPQVKLDPAAEVLHVTELGLTVLTPRHQPPGQPDLGLRLAQAVEIGDDLGRRVRPLPTVRIRRDAQFQQPLKLDALRGLFTQLLLL